MVVVERGPLIAVNDMTMVLGVAFLMFD